MNQDYELTLLTEGQVWGNDNEKQLDVLKRYGTKSAITDLVVLTGGYIDDRCRHMAPDDDTLTGRTGWTWTQSSDANKNIYIVAGDGSRAGDYSGQRLDAIRPVLISSSLINNISKNKMRGYNGTFEVEFGEYPQNAVDFKMQKELERACNRGLVHPTGKNYTFDSRKYNEYYVSISPVSYDELWYKGGKYIKIKVNTSLYGGRCELSNGIEYTDGDFVWVKVEPVKWLIDENTNLLVSKKGLVSGIMFDTQEWLFNKKFSQTEIKSYLDTYMLKDITKVSDMSFQENEEYELEKNRLEKIRNLYGLNFKKISEEQIIKGAIESGVAVFLHGPSSEGKSARVKQIDSTCEIIYLRNATPESLNGKSVYNGATGEMIDVPPTWLKKLEKKCEKEPDRLHILFFDEITNALPSIQGIAFNIVLDREVNGIWKLPENARIVAAGNDMKDSLAANQLAEPLFNRFAHVYIKTTTESWLKWASENNIHPAIYSYIAFKNGETLRSKYDGEKPNADPRKWEMASKMLYATGSPEMLRSLVGEDITREFVEFCSQPVITLEDVLNGTYTERDVQNLNTAERYATTMCLSQVDETEIDKVIDFVSSMGAEFVAVFDALWSHGDESRLERIAEAKLASKGSKTKVKDNGIH